MNIEDLNWSRSKTEQQLYKLFQIKFCADSHMHVSSSPVLLRVRIRLVNLQSLFRSILLCTKFTRILDALVFPLMLDKSRSAIVSSSARLAVVSELPRVQLVVPLQGRQRTKLSVALLAEVFLVSCRCLWPGCEGSRNRAFHGNECRAGCFGCNVFFSSPRLAIHRNGRPGQWLGVTG